MENNRITAVNAIVAKMMPYIETETTDKLKAVCLIVLNDYKLEKEETSLTLYEDKSLAYYIQKFVVAKKFRAVVIIPSDIMLDSSRGHLKP